MTETDFKKPRDKTSLTRDRWCGRIVADHERYRYNIILISCIASTLILLAFLAENILSGGRFHIVNYTAVACCMALLTLYLIISGNVRVMAPVIILAAYCGFFCSVFLEEAHGAHILIAFIFIPLALTLSSPRAGVRWILFFIFSILAAWQGVNSGVLPQWNLSNGNRQIAIGLISLFVMFLILYTARKHQEHVFRKLSKSVLFDRITGLPGKDYFIKHMKNVENSIIAIVHIMNFRVLSSVFGYEFSDSILVMLSDILRAYGEEHGFTVYKLAWHEFGIQIPVDREITPEEAEAVLRDIVDKVRATRTKWGDREIMLAICAGGVIVRGSDYSRAISGADAALGTGLKNHKSVTIFNDSMDIRVDALDVMTRFTDLHNNISGGTLKSYLQPVVHTSTGDVCWHEALLRVKGRDGEYGSVYPYLDVAKDTGLYPNLTDFMLRRACDIIKTTDLSISVNLCLRDMVSPAVLDRVREITANREYKPGRLILEILESENIEDSDSCFEFISRVKKMGVNIAIDDFGSGYSNYSNLLRMGVDIVKIDGALIRRLEHDDDAAVLINGIVDFCKKAERKIVAEYVENSWLLNKLSELKVNYCQGYLFGKPFDPDGEKV